MSDTRPQLGDPYRRRKDSERSQRRAAREQRFLEGIAAFNKTRTTIELFGADGQVMAANVWSRSRPQAPPYLMQRSPRGDWMHTDTRCLAWVNGQSCWHIVTLRELCEEMES